MVYCGTGIKKSSAMYRIPCRQIRKEEVLHDSAGYNNLRTAKRGGGTDLLLWYKTILC